MEKTFNPHDIEASWYQTWNDLGLFTAPDLTEAESSQTPFSIMIPPPNVTGSLHMGHAFQATLIDTLIRFQRMQGRPTLWQMGTDHAGIATQMVVERQLAQENISRQDLGREAFIERIWQWKAESGGMISQQLRRMGASLDWSRERFTKDEGFSNAVSKTFIDLYREGLIYRGKRLVNWDTQLKTAISDLEVITEEAPGHLWHFKYPINKYPIKHNNDQASQTNTHLIIATTRPETLLGDTAVAVHPDDERYQHLVGQTIALPLTGRTIPIIADPYVDPEFGTGCVKITPAHDFNDFEVGQRHQLNMINLLNPDGTLNDQVPTEYQGLDRFEARKKIVAALQSLNLVDKIEDYKHPIPKGDRSGTVIEPYLTEQWYVKTESLAKPAIEAVEKGQIHFVPKNWENTYYAWMRDLQDWCISRQLWWGHRIPAWYDAQHNCYVGHTEAEVREHYQLSQDIPLHQDEDVLDTWFSSALWTFATLGWPSIPDNLGGYHPTSVLITGFDIIFFWVARMMMMTLKLTHEIPFHTIYVHGLVRDAEGQKMSKSKGNVLDPIDIIDGISLDDLIKKRTQGMMQPHLADRIIKQTKKQFPEGIAAYGTDALRFTFLSLASTGRDIQFDMSRLEGYRNFCNKLWNAARFVLMNTESLSALPSDPLAPEHPIDQWIWQALEATRNTMITQLNQYRFDLAAQALYDFVWEEFCDWYLEFCKIRLTASDQPHQQAQKTSVQQHLIHLLDQTLRMAHPMLPFITEEIWQSIKGLLHQNQTSICQTGFPTSIATEAKPYPNGLHRIEWLKNLISQIRIMRSELGIPPGQKIPLVLKSSATQDRATTAYFQQEIMQLAKLAEIRWLNDEPPPPNALTDWLKTLEIHLPLEGLVDIAAENKKLNAQQHKIEQEIHRISQKLNNPKFTQKAPAEVVNKEQHKLAEYERQRLQITERICLLNQTHPTGNR